MEVHDFLWLLSNSRLLTQNNLAKRRDVSDPTCVFCREGNDLHLFFDCCVSRIIWGTVTKILELNVGKDFESMANL